MSDIRVRVEGVVGRITLARPQALNALTYEMIAAIEAAALRWSDDAGVRLVLIDGEGERAFCAGGDIQQVYDRGRRGDLAAARRFWADEYRLNARIAAYPKPWVALCQGFVMGGGVGVSLHGSHRVVCETTRVAMPECAIGLVPDVGGTALLAAAPGRLGEHLGLTGHRMGPGDAIRAGFADSFVPRDRWPALVARLLETGDADGAVAAFETAAPAADLEPAQSAIDAAFSAPDLATLADRLDGDHRDRDSLEALRRGCPLSMACTLALVRAARAAPGVPAALAREFRFSWRALSDGDLVEGIRAAVIDKDRAPRWSHTIDGVSAADVERMLAPLGADEWTPAPRTG